MRRNELRISFIGFLAVLSSQPSIGAEWVLNFKTMKCVRDEATMSQLHDYLVAQGKDCTYDELPNGIFYVQCNRAKVDEEAHASAKTRKVCETFLERAKVELKNARPSSNSRTPASAENAAEIENKAPVTPLKWKSGKLGQKPCSKDVLRATGLEAFQSKGIKFVQSVIELQNATGKLVGYVFVSGNECKPAFVEAGKSKVHTRMEGYSGGELPACSLQEVADNKMYPVIRAAAHDVAGWDGTGSMPWIPSGDIFCNTLTRSEETGCPDICKKFFGQGSKEEFCSKTLPTLHSIGGTQCDICCK